MYIVTMDTAVAAMSAANSVADCIVILWSDETLIDDRQQSGNSQRKYTIILPHIPSSRFFGLENYYHEL